MYEYPELESIVPIIDELHEAIKHDSLLLQCYKMYISIWRVEQPFNSKNFFIHLAYQALKMNQKHLKQVLKMTQKAVNPPVYLQQIDADGIYNKHVIDELIKKEARGYWQKLWAAIRGR